MREAVACEKGRREPFCLCALGLPSAEQISMATGTVRGKSSGGPHGQLQPLQVLPCQITGARHVSDPAYSSQCQALEPLLGLTTSFATLPFNPEAKPLTETRPLQSPRIALAHCQTLERSLGLTTSFPTLPFSPKATPLTDTFALANSKTRARDGRTTGASLAPSRLRRPSAVDRRQGYPLRSTMSGQAEN